MSIFRNLVKNSTLDREQENQLFDMLQRKSVPDLQAYLQHLSLDDRLCEQLCQLALLNGDISVIDEARRLYSDAGDEFSATLDQPRSTTWIKWCNHYNRNIPIR
jgi:ATP phosphoribosyltransferase regulatory subunit